MPTPLRLSWPCVVLLLGGALPAQEPAPSPAPDARLQQLLRELRTTDAAAWTARLQQIERDAKARDAEAAQLREQAAALQQRAEAAAAAAKALRAEGAKLQELQQLLQALPATAPAPAQPATPATPPPAAPAAPPPAKTMPAAPAPAATQPAVAVASKDDAAPAVVVAWPQVAAIFTASCTGCHEPGEQKGGLDLSTFRGALTGGGSGQSIVPGEPEQSRLWRMVVQEERPFMPRNAEPLPKGELATIRTWIEQGAAETAEAARAFVAERTRLAKAAAPSAAAETAPPTAAALPSEVPPLAVKRAARDAPIASLVRSPTAPLLAVPGVQQVLLLDGDGHLAAVLPSPLPQLGPLAFAEDGSTLLVTGGERGRRGVGVVHDVRTGAVLATVGAERDVPLAAALHQRAGLVALGGAGKHARVHRLRDGGVTMAGKHADFVLALAFAPDAAWLAAADRAGGVIVWETATGRVFQQLTGHQGAVHALAFDRGGKNLLTAGADGTLRLWDVAAAKERWRQNAHANQQALACAFGPGDVLASAGSDGVIATFSSAGKPGAKSKPAGDWLYALAFGNDGDHVLAGDWRGRLHCFDVAKKALTVVAPPATPE